MRISRPELPSFINRGLEKAVSLLGFAAVGTIAITSPVSAEEFPPDTSPAPSELIEELPATTTLVPLDAPVEVEDPALPQEAVGEALTSPTIAPEELQNTNSGAEVIGVEKLNQLAVQVVTLEDDDADEAVLPARATEEQSLGQDQVRSGEQQEIEAIAPPVDDQGDDQAPVTSQPEIGDVINVDGGPTSTQPPQQEAVVEEQQPTVEQRQPTFNEGYATTIANVSNRPVAAPDGYADTGEQIWRGPVGSVAVIDSQAVVESGSGNVIITVSNSESINNNTGEVWVKRQDGSVERLGSIGPVENGTGERVVVIEDVATREGDVMIIAVVLDGDRGRTSMGAHVVYEITPPPTTTTTTTPPSTTTTTTTPPSTTTTEPPQKPPPTTNVPPIYELPRTGRLIDKMILIGIGLLAVGAGGTLFARKPHRR